MHVEITSEDQKIIDLELELFQFIHAELLKAYQKRNLNKHKIGNRLKDLRDEAAKAKTADLPALFDQMNIQRALVEHKSEKGLPDIRSPYFAHMRLKEGGKIKDVLLGHVSFLDPFKCPIIDWRHAPVSRIFFNYRQGDEYEEELPGRIAEGEVVMRNVLTIKDEKVVMISNSDVIYHLIEGQWVKQGHGAVPEMKGGAGSAQRGMKLGTGQSALVSAEVSALLDAGQYEILNSDEDEPLLVLGGAGCGKTTVALHRISSLLYKNPRKYRQSNMGVIVPEKGLVRLSRKLLDGLGLRGVAVETFDDWVVRTARKVLKGIPKKLCDHTPASVVKFKRHPAMRTIFPEVAENTAKNLSFILKSKVYQGENYIGIIENSAGGPLLERIRVCEKTYLADMRSGSESGQKRIRSAQQAFNSMRSSLYNIASDREDLFAKKDLLLKVVAKSEGMLSEGNASDVLKHTLKQFDEGSEERYSGIDISHLKTIDGSSLQEDFDDETAKTIDVEDFAVLMDFVRFKTGLESFRKDVLYKHLLIDEAQDLAPVELSALGMFLAPDSSVTISGDAAQQVDPSTSFKSWEHVLEMLGLPVVSPNHLKTTYRSTEPIAAFAHKVLGPIAPKQPPRSIKDGVPVVVSDFPDEGPAIIFLTEALSDLQLNEPSASVAIICRNYESSKRFYQALKNLPNVRWIPDGEFDFKPGIDVTIASEVKGLEFDYVIIPDANAGYYHDKNEDRRLLHVAATRAIHQLWVMTIGSRSSIIKGL